MSSYCHDIYVYAIMNATSNVKDFPHASIRFFHFFNLGFCTLLALNKFI